MKSREPYLRLLDSFDLIKYPVQLHITGCFGAGRRAIITILALHTGVVLIQEASRSFQLIKITGELKRNIVKPAKLMTKNRAIMHYLVHLDSRCCSYCFTVRLWTRKSVAVFPHNSFILEIVQLKRNIVKLTRYKR